MYNVYTSVGGIGEGYAYRPLWAEVGCDSLHEAREAVKRLQHMTGYDGVAIQYQGEIIETHYVGKVYYRRTREEYLADYGEE